jgi:hypothetical protein
MAWNVMPEHLLEQSPVLESFVDRFLSVSDSLLHEKSFFGVGKACWTFDTERMFTDVAIICFNSFIGLKVA